MTIRKPPGKRLASQLLSLALLLTLVPAMGTTALAANPAPAANFVLVDDGKSFYDGAGNQNRLYYKNGDEKDKFTGDKDNYNAHYDPATGVLTLKGYEGGSISVGGTTPADLIIKLIDNNNTVSGSVSSDMGGDITISSDSKGSLVVTNYADSSGNVCGIATSLNQNFGSVTITGNANVKIDATNTTTNTGNAYGIYARESITISGNASVDITCSTPYTTRSDFSCVGMFVPDSSSGSLTIDTDGDIQIDARYPGSDACSFGLYAPNYTLTKVGSMEVQWKGSSGGAIYGTGAFDDATHAVNVDTSSCYASYRHGTPYKVTVAGGRLTGPGVKYERNSGYFLAGDMVMLVARELKDTTGATKIPFDKWVSDDVTITNSETQDGASFTVPDKNVTVTAQYNGFTVQPEFTRTSDTAGKISFTLISGNFDSTGKPNIYPVGSSTPLNYSYTSDSATQKTFTVYKNDCPDNQYVVGVSYGGVVCYSEPFRVKYTKPSAYVNEAVTVSGSANQELEQNYTVTVKLNNDKFASSLPGGWIQNLPDGLSQSVTRTDDRTATITITGTPKVGCTADMEIIIPAGALVDESSTPVTVSTGGNAKFDIKSNAPTADKIVIGGTAFSNGNSYYKNGADGAFGGFTGTSSDYNAKYDPQTGTLTLNGYDGPHIKINETSSEQTVIIKLEGNDSTVTGNYVPAIQLSGGVNLIVTAGADANLNLTGGTNRCAIGPFGGETQLDNAGAVTITGKANVTINASGNHGVVSGKDVAVQGGASLNITCNTSGYGIYTRMGTVTVDTVGTVDINVSGCGAGGRCISAGGIKFEKAEMITLKYVPASGTWGSVTNPTTPSPTVSDNMKSPKTDPETVVAGQQTTVTYAKKGAPPAAPTISAYSLTFDQLQEVTLTCTTPGTVIYYTTDGSDPKDSSSTRTQYSESFYVRQSCTLKAVAYSAADERYSAVAEAVFTRNPVSITVVGGGKAYSDPERIIEITQAEPGTTVYLKAPPETEDGTKVFSDWSSTAKITNKESCDSAYFVMPATQPTITASYKPKPAGVTVSGQVTSYNGKNDFTVTLYEAGTKNAKHTATVSGTGTSGQVTQDFSIASVAAGTYDLVVTKDAHLTYTIQNVKAESSDLDLTTMTGKAYQTITLLAGDINNDGSINPTDINVIYQANNYYKSTSEAATPIADLNGDGSINPDDINIIYHAANYYKSVNDCTFEY